MQLVLCSQLQEANQVSLPIFEVKDSWCYLMEIPKNVDTDCIQAQPFDHLQAMLPILPWNPSEMDLSSPNWNVFQNIIDLPVPSTLSTVYNMSTLSIQRLK